MVSYYHDINFTLSKARRGLAGFDSHEVVIVNQQLVNGRHAGARGVDAQAAAREACPAQV
jgi:hypothetical protein